MTTPVLLGFYGRSNSGKTTLLEAVIPLLIEEGIRVATIKQTHHNVTADAKGKDTWRHRKAGAEAVALSSDVETALFIGRKLTLDDTVKMICSVNEVDLILLEGWKDADVPKVFLGEGEEKPNTVLYYDGDPKKVVELIMKMLT
ncbi:MAG: molybdopterin-guanine dinucleotide biosynthesis protein B [Euryarchaeota archaeon]|nr:molybdopterin-guanine dinucleotide biosynthesis protein B [Euryarchaeota archaeon]